MGLRFKGLGFRGLGSRGLGPQNSRFQTQSHHGFGLPAFICQKALLSKVQATSGVSAAVESKGPVLLAIPWPAVDTLPSLLSLSLSLSLSVSLSMYIYI